TVSADTVCYRQAPAMILENVGPCALIFLRSINCLYAESIFRFCLKSVFCNVYHLFFCQNTVPFYLLNGHPACKQRTDPCLLFLQPPKSYHRHRQKVCNQRCGISHLWRKRKRFAL